jgi:hypothetical protein
MKKFNMAELKPLSTLMSTAAALDPDKNGEAVDHVELLLSLASMLMKKFNMATPLLCSSNLSSHDSTMVLVLRLNTR